MISIWKFALQTTDIQEIKIPIGAELLTVQIQNGQPYLWARVDTEELIETRKIAIHGTGHELPCTKRKYIGTYQMTGGVTAIKAMVQRHDDKPLKNHWKEMQEIKNELFGREATGIEYYPAETELENHHNIYWLWILPEGKLPIAI